jgi:hypothetical protein
MIYSPKGTTVANMYRANLNPIIDSPKGTTVANMYWATLNLIIDSPKGTTVANMYWATILQHRKVGPKGRLDFSNTEISFLYYWARNRNKTHNSTNPKLGLIKRVNDRCTDINRMQQYIPRVADSRLAPSPCCRCAFTKLSSPPQIEKP